MCVCVCVWAEVYNAVRLRANNHGGRKHDERDKGVYFIIIVECSLV